MGWKRKKSEGVQVMKGGKRMGNLMDIGKIPSLKRLVYDNLKERIISGELKPGTRLREEDLSVEMNISRAPIREAFNMLERDGLSVIVPRKGAVVAEATEEERDYIWEMRAILEPYAAVKSMSLISDEKIAKLENDLKKVLENPDDLKLYMDSDIELHEMLFQNLENHFMKDTLENMRAHSLRMRWAVENRHPGIRSDIEFESTKEHLQILDALKRKDEKAVYQTVYDHLINSRERIFPSAGQNLKKE